MNRMNKLLVEVLSEIKPTKEEEKYVFKYANRFVKKINKLMNGKAKAVIGGSVGKGTFLIQKRKENEQ